MAKRQLNLSEQEIAGFRRQEDETSDPSELKRLQAVRAYGTGKAIEEIADIVDCHVDSIRRWAKVYREQGLAALAPQWATQNAAKLTRKQKTELKTRLERYRPAEVLAPENRIRSGQFWTVSDVRVVVEQWYAVVYEHDSSYRRLLHFCGFSYQKVEQVYRSQASEQVRLEFEAALEKK
jgi:transposase